MLLMKEQYVRKRIHNGCSVRTENYITQDNCSASRGLPSYPRDIIFNGISRPLKILKIWPICVATDVHLKIH